MRVLYIGDIMGEVGVEVVEKVLPKLKAKEHFDLVIAQAENVTEGRGIIPADFDRLKNLGIDFCTGGNWSLHHPSIVPVMEDPEAPIIRPANYPAGTPCLSHKYAKTAAGN